jgi:hypothetical protein
VLRSKLWSVKLVKGGNLTVSYTIVLWIRYVCESGRMRLYICFYRKSLVRIREGRLSRDSYSVPVAFSTQSSLRFSHSLLKLCIENCSSCTRSCTLFCTRYHSMLLDSSLVVFRASFIVAISWWIYEQNSTQCT